MGWGSSSPKMELQTKVVSLYLLIWMVSSHLNSSFVRINPFFVVVCFIFLFYISILCSQRLDLLDQKQYKIIILWNIITMIYIYIYIYIYCYTMIYLEANTVCYSKRRLTANQAQTRKNNWGHFLIENTWWQKDPQLQSRGEKVYYWRENIWIRFSH